MFRMLCDDVESIEITDITDFVGYHDVYGSKDQADVVVEAKRLVRSNIAYFVTDSPTPAHVGNSAENAAFLERAAEVAMEKSLELLKACDYSDEQLEDAFGCNGYQTAIDWAMTDTYFITWRSRVKMMIQAHEKEAAEFAEKLQMPIRYNFSYSTKEKRRLEQKLSWSKRQQKFVCYVYNLDLAKATRWHEKCKETEQELLDDFMEDPDTLEVMTMRLADRIKKCYEVRIHWLEHCQTKVTFTA